MEATKAAGFSLTYNLVFASHGSSPGRSELINLLTDRSGANYLILWESFLLPVAILTIILGYNVTTSVSSN